MRVLSKLFSTLFNPLAVPLIAAILIIWANPIDFGGARSMRAAQFLYSVGLCTFIMPAVGILVMKRLDFIGDHGPEGERQEKIIEYFMIISCYSIGLYFINQIDMPSIVRAMMFGATASIILSFFWGNFLNVSAHGVGMGTLLGVDLGLFAITYRDLSQFFILALLITGFVLTAQLILKRHSLKEVLIGFVIGFICQILAFSLFFALGV